MIQQCSSLLRRWIVEPILRLPRTLGLAAPEQPPHGDTLAARFPGTNSELIKNLCSRSIACTDAYMDRLDEAERLRNEVRQGLANLFEGHKRELPSLAGDRLEHMQDMIARQERDIKQIDLDSNLERKERDIIEDGLQKNCHTGCAGIEEFVSERRKSHDWLLTFHADGFLNRAQEEDSGILLKIAEKLQGETDPLRRYIRARRMYWFREELEP
ncbi:hypothetical protein BDV96DRAFT_655142 [Lophiotrema nucula]|uniref:Uncharacterized protein n=1 Tax=Lophiotrema nucula TaxID=690887 RepID=A0A6A5YFE2_9PLEO|nr:hypothetical protein BDV96DRAFT_655142 [Lophiotrema nucula]